MGWPLSQDYNEAIQHPEFCFRDAELRAGQAATNALGLPVPRSGNFADVYEVRGPAGRWAVKCFTRQVPGLQERYAAVSAHLRRSRLPFGVEFEYLADGIRVGGRWYPVLKMQWVEGLLLNEFVRDHLDKPALLDALLQIWGRMGRRLREAEVAHADLQHGNVLLVPGSKAASLAVKLIDYDGTWVPDLAGRRSGEVGHPAYQHPQRLREGTYSADVDRFPLLLVATALRGLRVGGRPLWDRHDNGDNLLFREADLKAPGQSAVFRELWRLDDPTVRVLTGMLALAIQGPLEAVPPVDQLLEEGTTPALTATQERQAAALLGVAPRVRVGVPPPSAAKPAPGAAFDFGGGGASTATRHRTGGGPPWWLWVAGSAAAVVLGAGLVLLATSKSTRGPDAEAVATAPRLTRPTEREAAESDGGKPEPEPEPDKPVPKEPRDLAAGLPVFGPIGEVRRHQGPAPFRGVALSPDAKQVATAGDDGVVRLWDAGGREVRSCQGHQGPVGCVAFSPDGRRLLSGGQDRTVRLWDAATGRALRRFDGHADRVEGVSFSQGPNGVFSAGRDGTVRLWDVDSGKERARCGRGPTVPALAVTAAGDRVLLAYEDHSVALWDVAGEKEVLRMPGHSGPVHALALSADGRLGLSASADGTLRLWDLESGQEKQRFAGHGGPVPAAALSAGGQRVLSGGQDQTLRLWDAETGRELCVLHGHTGEVRAVALTADGLAAVSGGADGTLRWWRLPPPAAFVVKAGGPAKQEILRLDGHTAQVDDVAFSPGGAWALSGGQDRTVRLWDLASGRELRGFDGHTDIVESVAFSPDGRRALSGSRDRTVRLWDVGSAKELYCFKGHRNGVRTVSFSADGKQVLTGGGGVPQRDYTVRLWDVASGVGRRTLQGHRRAVLSAAFLPDGRRALSGGIDSVLRLWDLEEGRALKTLAGHEGSVHRVAVTPDGRFAVSAGSDGKVRRWDLEAGKELPALEGHAGEVLGLDLSPDGRRALTGGADRTVRLWDLEAGKELQRFEGHQGSVTGVAVSPDGRYGLSAGADRSLRLWRLPPAVLVVGKPLAVRPPEVKVVGKPPPPDRAEQDAVMKEIEEDFREEYSRKRTADKQALAELLLQRGQEASVKPARRFVLLREALDLAAAALDLPLACRAVDELAAAFDVDALEMKTAAVEQAGRAATTFAAHRRVAEGALDVLDEAQSADDYAAAARLLKVAQEAAFNSQDVSLRTRVLGRVNQTEGFRKEYEALKETVRTLAAKPEDPDANLALGRFQCLVKGSWDRGLPLLARGADPRLRALAEKDLAAPEEDDERLALADGWWDLGEKEQGTARTSLFRRAFTWYERSAPGLDGDDLDRAERRMQSLLDKSLAPPAWELRIIAVIDGRDELRLGATETAWVHQAFTHPTRVRLGTRPWNPQQAPTLKGVGVHTLLRQRVDLATARVRVRRGRGAVDFKVGKEYLTLAFNDPARGTGTYEIVLTFGR